MYEFYQQNRSYCISFIVLTILCLAGVWLVCDYYRNEPIYSDTDTTMADLEERVGRIESRVDSLSARLDKAEKTATDLGGRIESSTSLAKEVGAGIDGVEKRIDSAIQRSGRIANIIDEIERANRPGEKSSSQTDMAK